MATAKNDITGDLIKTKGTSSAYEENLGAIDWSVKRDGPKTPSDKPIEHAENNMIPCKSKT